MSTCASPIPLFANAIWMSSWAASRTQQAWKLETLHLTPSYLNAELEMLQGILSALDGLECTVIWSLKATEQQLLADAGLRLPAHVHAFTWVPQNDLLGWPGMRAFVTQAGSNSVSGAPVHSLLMPDLKAERTSAISYPESASSWASMRANWHQMCCCTGVGHALQLFNSASVMCSTCNLAWTGPRMMTHVDHFMSWQPNSVHARAQHALPRR